MHRNVPEGVALADGAEKAWKAEERGDEFSSKLLAAAAERRRRRRCKPMLLLASPPPAPRFCAPPTRLISTHPRAHAQARQAPSEGGRHGEALGGGLRGGRARD